VVYGCLYSSLSLFRHYPGLLTGISVLLLVVYLVASLGVIPSPRVVMGWFGQMVGERYPCESCGCGCASATECWTHCCCHTEQQRLVWAIENGVMPPAAVEFSDEQWIAAANAVKSRSAHCVLCVERIKEQLRQGVATPHEGVALCACDAGCGRGCGKACCEKDGKSEAVSVSCCSKNKGSSWPGPWISALSCKGLEQLLMFCLPPAPLVRVVEIILPEPVPFVPERPDDVVCSSRSLDVRELPPRA